MSLQLLHSEFPYIWGKFSFLFYQCCYRWLSLGPSCCNGLCCCWRLCCCCCFYWCWRPKSPCCMLQRPWSVQDLIDRRGKSAYKYTTSLKCNACLKNLKLNVAKVNLWVHVCTACKMPLCCPLRTKDFTEVVQERQRKRSKCNLVIF